jgi:hypothetical protein
MGRRSTLSARSAHSESGLGCICGIAGALRLWDCCSPWTPRSCQEGPWPEPVDPAQDLREQRSGHRHLGQLEHDVATVAHDPGADLDQLLSSRPVSDHKAERSKRQLSGRPVAISRRCQASSSSSSLASFRSAVSDQCAGSRPLNGMRVRTSVICAARPFGVRALGRRCSRVTRPHPRPRAVTLFSGC